MDFLDIGVDLSAGLIQGIPQGNDGKYASAVGDWLVFPFGSGMEKHDFGVNFV